MSPTNEYPLINILIVEDHPMMRRGLSGQFYLEPGFIVVGEVADGEQEIELASSLQPDIILMDIDLPIIDGITATQQIKSALPKTCIKFNYLSK
jgi:DNA-binding NarL/FixJ family response regulator